jgi:hypothetical protein
MDAASIGATGIRAAGNLLSLALSSQWRRGDALFTQPPSAGWRSPRR